VVKSCERRCAKQSAHSNFIWQRQTCLFGENDMPQYPADIDVSTLNGADGFKIFSTDLFSRSGTSVASAGDINGDGFADVIVAKHGAAYVVFGKAEGFDPFIHQESIDGSNGFKLSGGGPTVASAGDVNGDAFADMIVSASEGAYVLFGTASGFGSNVDLTSLDGTNGFRLNGVAPLDQTGDPVASAGDVNGDGFADLIVGAWGADPNGSASGASYVVFGKAGGFDANIALSSLDGSNGFRLSGEAAGDLSGWSVASAGDVNGDGFDDLIIGADRADPHGSYSGASYVVFGKADGFSWNVDLSSLDGTNGFKLSGAAADDLSGYSVASAGDVNGDGFADLIIGAHRADPNGQSSGASYVVFGNAEGFASNIDLSSLDGNTGFQISGEAFDGIGYSVASAGDVNGDGFDDVIVGSRYNLVAVVFGKTGGFDPNIDVSSLDGSNGFEIFGTGNDTGANWSVASAGDINGDGFDDLIVGNPDAAIRSGYYTYDAGASYVIFGRAPDSAVARTGTGASQTLAGGAFDDTLSGMGGDDELFGHGGNDNLDGGAGNDALRGGAGGDVMAGGLGNDTYYVDAAQDMLQESSNQGLDTVHTTVSFTLATNVEILIADSDAGLALRGNGLDNKIIGGVGNDALLGDNGSDFLLGGGGNDKLDGGAGADVMNGGVGNDRYYVDDMGDAIIDLSGTDSVYSSVNHTLGADFERLYANSDSGLVLTGNAGVNVIEGGGGNDDIDGGDGSDRLSGGDGMDMIFGGIGSDTIDGGAGNDTLDGGIGRDTLIGGIGADILTGGGGNDTFVYQSLADSGIGAANRDSISDFGTGDDTIDLSAIDANTGAADDQAFSFIGAGPFTQQAGELQATFAGGNTLIAGDVDGDGQADFQILLTGNVALQETDFLP
jgi:Ca2+-binding RTX toxin-like protein